MMHKYFAAALCAAFLGLLFSGCITTDTAYTRVPPGIWRGVLSLEKFSMPTSKKDTVVLLTDQFKDGELPFNFEVTYIDNERFYIDIINGTERIRCDSIRYGRDRTKARDTMNIYFPEYQSYIHTDVRGGVMQGEWVVTTKENYKIPFYAHSGKDFRFTNMREKPIKDLTGSWATLFGVEQPTQDKAIGEFKQKDNHLEGTFRTETGDYRFLEGTVQGRKFYLSCFDGAHAFLFTGSIKGDSLQGEFRSGKHLRTLWTAWKDPSFQLGNPDTLTHYDAQATLQFERKTPEGSVLRYPGPEFDNKVSIFTISGTWCPNCKDEQLFLRDYLRAHPEVAGKIAVTSFSFERNKEVEKANLQLVNYKKRLELPYPLVYGGMATTAEAAKLFPMLRNISAFPTMIIVDKKHKIRQVHTGFDGPATSKFKDFQQEFETLMTTLVAEPGL
jgi:thiol-disulfide isomerase/thioredoxin